MRITFLAKIHRLRIKIRRWVRSIYLDYPEYVMRNGIKVRKPSRNSVNSQDAIRANWHEIKKMMKGK